MDLIIILTILKLLVFAVAFFLFLFKYRSVQQFKARNRKVGGRWILWYASLEIQGTSSPARRHFMKTNNRLSTIMWICILIGVLLLILPF
jgi:hypothetical protein